MERADRERRVARGLMLERSLVSFLASPGLHICFALRLRAQRFLIVSAMDWNDTPLAWDGIVGTMRPVLVRGRTSNSMDRPACSLREEFRLLLGASDRRVL